MILARIASFVLSLQLDLQMTLAEVVDHLDHCSLILRNLPVGSVRQSWEIETYDRFDDSLRRGYASGCAESKNVGCDGGCESDALVNGIFPSAIC